MPAEVADAAVRDIETVLLGYSEWLDAQGQLVPDRGRDHTELMRAYLFTDHTPREPGTTRPPWWQSRDQPARRRA